MPREAVSSLCLDLKMDVAAQPVVQSAPKMDIAGQPVIQNAAGKRGSPRKPSQVIRKRGRPRKERKVIAGAASLPQNTSFEMKAMDQSVLHVLPRTTNLLQNCTFKMDVLDQPVRHCLPRKRGRPPKLSELISGAPTLFQKTPHIDMGATGQPLTQSLPRKRGRPPKQPKVSSITSKLLQNSQSVTPRTRSGFSISSLDTQLVKPNGPTSQGDISPVTDDIEMNNCIVASAMSRPRGRPSKHAIGHGNTTIIGQTRGALIAGRVCKELEELKMKKDRLPPRTGSGHGRRYYKCQPQSLTGMPAPSMLLPLQVDATEENVRATPFMDAVVKVFCVHTEPNFSLPWQRKRQFSSNSSGFIISGRRVLTNAHSVEHHTQVKVKKRGSDTKFLASVLAIGTECDIAMLTVSDNEFWEGVTPVKFGALPSLQDPITVVGYPIGGDTISVTSGVVSRIEVTSYVYGATELLGLQIDAAINAGNSGGPAFNDKDQCVGIAFQALKHEDAENIGYVIPTPVISHFIKDYEQTGDYTGFPYLGIEWQKMENPDLRKALGMKTNQKGVRVRRVEPTSPAAQFLQPSDILLSFDGIDIANDGTVSFRHGERIAFTYLVSQKYTGEKANICILREGKYLGFKVELATHTRIVPAHIKGKPPSYYIIAGVVFSAVSVPYLRSEYGKDYDYDAPVKLLDKLLHSMAETEEEQLVVVSQVLVADINIGYEDIVNTQIMAFNGVAVKNLKHLAHMVEMCKEEFLRFDLEYEQILVLETAKANAATPDILATHCIPSAMSDDLKK
eukprot:c22518_g1_i3 orf=508-2871(-)